MNEKIPYKNISEFISEKTKEYKESSLKAIETASDLDMMMRVSSFVKPDPGCLSRDAHEGLTEGILAAYHDRFEKLDLLRTELIAIQIATLLNTFGKRCSECSRTDECEYAE